MSRHLVRSSLVGALVLLLVGFVAAQARGPMQATPAWAASPPPGAFDLTSQVNNVGISSDSDPGSADFDGAGFSSYSADALSAAGLTAGQTVTVMGVDFAWPSAAPGQNDNVVAQGQILTAPPATSGTTLGFLGSADNAPITGTRGIGTITYGDSSTQSFILAWSDWTLGGGTGTPIAADSIVVSTTYRNTGSGAQAIPTYVFYTSVTLTPGKTVASVTLPASTNNAGRLHVFAISIAGGSSATSTPTSTPTRDGQ